MISAWDRCIVAKNLPGAVNVPFVAGMNVLSLPTTCFNVSNTFELAPDLSASPVTNKPLGTEDYTVLAWMPSATARYGTGDAG